MKLILNSDVKSLGRKGDVVDVAKGYARNYLLPKKLAVVATSSNLKFAEALREKREIQAEANNELAESIKTALADAKIVISQNTCLLYTSPSPRDTIRSRMPSSA